MDYDVVVAGGGLVGAAMARALAQSRALNHKKILLLEGGTQRDYRLPPEYSNRVIALNPSSQALFVRLGVWNKIQEARVKTVEGMHVWDDGGSLVSFQAEDENEGRAHFYIAENDLVVHCLMQSVAAESPNVEIRYGASALQCQREDVTSIRLKDGQEVRTDLLIGADGANSVVRKALGNGSRYLAKDYEQMGVVATLHLDAKIPNTVAWQKFLPGGPIALLPLSEDRSSLVWTLPTAQAKILLKAPEEEVWHELLRNLGPPPPDVDVPFPSVTKVSQVAGFPLGLGHSTRYCQSGMVLIGDAAHRVHPLAGQGVNLGFGDVEALVRCLEANVLDGAKFGAETYLLDYESERQRANVPMMLGIDFFQQVYCSDNALVATARKAGIAVVNANPMLKKIIANFAA